MAGSDLRLTPTQKIECTGYLSTSLTFRRNQSPLPASLGQILQPGQQQCDAGLFRRMVRAPLTNQATILQPTSTPSPHTPNHQPGGGKLKARLVFDQDGKVACCGVYGALRVDESFP